MSQFELLFKYSAPDGDYSINNKWRTSPRFQIFPIEVMLLPVAQWAKDGKKGAKEIERQTEEMSAI